MKKSVLLSMSLALGLSLATSVQFEQVEAATKEVKYSTCKELNKVYANGVRKSKDTKNAVYSKKNNKTSYKATNAVVNAELYKMNTHLDKDEDGIACEK